MSTATPTPTATYARGGRIAGGGGRIAGGGGRIAAGGGRIAAGGGRIAGGPFAAGLIAGGPFASGLNAAHRRKHSVDRGSNDELVAVAVAVAVGVVSTDFVIFVLYVDVQRCNKYSIFLLK